MNWADAMRDNAKLASTDRAATDESAVRSTQSTSWDPHEVWLTRIKRPRESAARLVAARAVKHASEQPD